MIVSWQEMISCFSRIYIFICPVPNSTFNEVKIANFNVRKYCPEKTICDCFRYRNKLGLDIAREGLSEYLKRNDRSLEKLLEYAGICRVKPVMNTWLDALI